MNTTKPNHSEVKQENRVQAQTNMLPANPRGTKADRVNIRMLANRAAYLRWALRHLPTTPARKTHAQGQIDAFISAAKMVAFLAQMRRMDAGF
jgi:hypothetical protein